MSSSDDLHPIIDKALAGFFAPHERTEEAPFSAQYADTDIQRISELLGHIKESWSRVPRTYIVLRTIGQLHVLEDFIDLGFTDHWFPVSSRSLPNILSPTVRANFVQAQNSILTKSIELEKGDGGQHRNFSREEPLPFRTVAVLGSGGYGKVDKVLSTISFREYARKLIKRRAFFRKAQGEMEAFTAELSVLKRLKHRHMVEFVGSYTSPSYLGLIMTPVADSNLTEYLGHGLLTADQKSLMRGFFGCLVTALAYLHDSKIRHKDIKPENILVKGGNVLLTDFGLARDWNDGSGSTTEGLTALSPRYCSPEVASYEPRNASADIWSLGCVFLEMVTALKGYRIDTMRRYLEEHGSHGAFIRTNVEATEQWVDTLRQAGSILDSRPLEWTQRMLNHDRLVRPTAMQLVQTVAHSTSAFDMPFCGLCCLGDDEESDIDSPPEEVDKKFELRFQTGKPLVHEGDSRSHVRQVSSSDLPYPTQERQTLYQSPDEDDGEDDGKDAGRPASPAFIIKDGTVYHFNTNEPTNEAAKGMWWLFHGAETGKIALVRRALESGVEVNRRGDLGETALFWACRGNHPDLALWLLDSGSDANARSRGDSTALHWAAARGLPHVISLLLKRGAVVDSTDDEGKTPLFKAIAADSADSVFCLLEAGANINAKAYQPQMGWSTLDEAAFLNNTIVLGCLLGQGADTNIKNQDGDTALGTAAHYGHDIAIEMLLDYGADLESAGILGYFPLHRAVSSAHLSAAAILLRRGSDRTAVDDFGRTPLDIAKDDGQTELIKILEK
ncbi:MAG: hypothetical protein M1833_005112 [Piccolia ochrophora]|nr:MAG: hypothetical protein M1833_005112 [Piccolia ochrophora]